MKILITGGAGFIASHVGDEYIKTGHSVVVIDNLLTGFKKNLNPKAKFYKGDIRDAAFVKKVFQKEKPHVVNHHAAIAEVVKSLRDPIPTIETNVRGTANVLIAAGEVGIKRFIFSSTGGAIYGEPDKIPADERTPQVPLSPYGLSKLLGEELITFYARHYGFSYILFRYPNVYGPRQNPKGEAGVIAIFGGMMKHGETPIIFGDGTKTRDYTYVGDIARANLLALSKGKNEVINLGWGKKVSDQDIYDTIAKNLQITKKPHYKPFRKGEVYQIALSAKKAKKILGWSPKIALKEGIANVLTTLS
jgi:UDP-glucose 4-epimerase